MTIAALRAEMKDGFKRVDDEFAAVHAEFTAVRAEIGQSADDTRRYFQMLAEQMRDSVAIVAEGTAHNTSRLDDHEGRLKAIEKLRRS